MEEIRHTGIVKEIKANSVIVGISSLSPCSSCHARGACTVSDQKEKEIEVIAPDNSFRAGEAVTIFLRETLGMKALVFGYLLPLLLVVVTLFTMVFYTKNELLGAVAALGSLIPYYIVLSFFRKKLKHLFRFEIEKQHNQMIYE